MKNYSLTEIESPFFALSHVRTALIRPMEMTGLADLIIESGSSLDECLFEMDKARVLMKVERGEWLLISDGPFSPLSDDCYGRYSHLTGIQFSPTGTRRRKVESEKLKEQEFLTLAENVESYKGSVGLKEGPGKWVVTEVRYDTLKNTLAILVNRSGSLTEEGRLMFSDGKDFVNTTRTVVKEWVSLNEEEKSFMADSAAHAYGSLRNIKQRFLQASDEWHSTGKSWHWVPAAPDTDYERRASEK